MDEFDFGFEATELSTSALSMSFGPTGRISHLWVSDAANAMGADQQFVAAPVPMGDETSDEYLPGTILLGVRTDPDEPWIVSRNTAAEIQAEENSVDISYEFNLLREVEVTGKFYEKPDQAGVVVWEITVKNISKQSIEIGELGFPFALLTSLDGYPISDDGMNSMLTERLVVQKFIGGAGSFISARRLCGDPPGLLIFPGHESPWEFMHSSPLSVRVSAGWTGVPIVYIHSKATVEREDWGEWLYGHSSMIFEPKEEKTYQILFATMSGRHGFDVPSALSEFGVPTFRPFPGAVVPIDMPFQVEMSGMRPAIITSDVENVEVESETDEHGGGCIIRASEPGELRLYVEDMSGRESWCHLLVTSPIADLIQARASWICSNQFATDGFFKNGILPADNTTGIPIDGPFDSPWGITASLADATFLAEKNRIYYDPSEVQILDDYVEKFLLKRFHKPGQNTFGAMCPAWNDSIAMDASRAQLYVYAINLYLSLSQIHTGLTKTASQFIELGQQLLDGMLKYADREGFASQALVGTSRLYTFPSWVEYRENFLERFRLPFWSSRVFSTNSLEEVSILADADESISAMCSVEQLLLTHKSPAPNWWSYGNEPRSGVDQELNPYLSDFGEISCAPTTIANALAMTSWLRRDYTRLDEPGVRLAFGAMLAPWALVRQDGAAALGFCPDQGSSHRGLSCHTGDIGFALADYLQHSTVYLLSSAEKGFVCYGAVFDSYPKDGKTILRLEPKDGIGRRIVVRHLNLIVEADGAKIETLEFDINLRWLTLTLDNPSSYVGRAVTVSISGLWGTSFDVTGASGYHLDGENLILQTSVDVSKLQVIEVNVRAD